MFTGSTTVFFKSMSVIFHFSDDIYDLGLFKSWMTFSLINPTHGGKYVVCIRNPCVNTRLERRDQLKFKEKHGVHYYKEVRNCTWAHWEILLCQLLIKNTAEVFLTSICFVIRQLWFRVFPSLLQRSVKTEAYVSNFISTFEGPRWWKH